MLRIIPITLDISKVGSQKTVTGIRRNDSNTVKFAISLVDGSSPVNLYDLGSATIIMFGLKPDGKIIINYAEFDYSENKIVYTLNAQDTSAAGVVKWQVKIFENANTVFATPEFASVIDGDSVDGDDIDSRDSVKALYEAIEYVNELITNNNLSSRYSFMFDIQGRIFSYTWDTDISPNSFAKYSKYEEKINAGHIVWLASNVTNVQSGALGNADKVSSIRCEAPQDKITLNDYSECNVQYGSSTLSQFYILATISWLLNEKADTPVELSSLSSNVQDLITKRYSFMFDIQGRIFSYTRDTDISPNSFAKYSKYEEKINATHIVWLASNVTNVQSGALGNADKVSSIRCEAPQDKITLNDYSECNVQYGSSTLSQFYILATISWLLNEKADTPVELSSLSSNVQDLITNSLRRIEDSVSTISRLELMWYCQTNNIYTLTLTGDIAQSFGVADDTRAEMSVSGSWDTYITRVITFPESSAKWIQIVEGVDGSSDQRTYGTWTKVGGNELTYTQIKNIDGSSINLNTLNQRTFTPFKFYYLYKGTDIIPDLLTNEYVLFFSLTPTAQFIILADGTIYKRTRESTAWEWSAFTKTTAEIESTLGTLNYNQAQALSAIQRLNKTTVLIPDYSIGFNSDGIMIKSSNLLTLGGGDFNSDCSSVYVAQKVTSINNTFFVTAPNVTDLYIDNNEGAVTLPSNIPATVTVHYKDEFKLSDLLVNSAIASNTKLLNLENTFNGLINGDEVAY